MRLVGPVCFTLATIAVISNGTTGAEEHDLSDAVKSDYDPIIDREKAAGMVAVGSAPVQYLLIIPRACFSLMRTPRHILLRRWKRRSLFARSGQYSRNIERRIPAEQNTNEQPFTDKV